MTTNRYAKKTSKYVKYKKRCDVFAAVVLFYTECLCCPLIPYILFPHVNTTALQLLCVEQLQRTLYELFASV